MQAESLLLDNRASKHLLPLCEYIRQSGVPVLQSFVTHCGTHSLMRLIIADGSTVASFARWAHRAPPTPLCCSMLAVAAAIPPLRRWQLMKHFQQGEHQPSITLEEVWFLSQGCMIPQELLFWKVCRPFLSG